MGKFDVSMLAGGAVGEQIQMEVQKVYDNIVDLNTGSDKARKLTITVTFKPQKTDTEVVDVSVLTKSTLSPVKAIGTTLLIEKDSDGKAVANEWDKGAMKNQLILEGEKTVTEDGEIIESTGVIDFQKNKRAE